MLSFRRCSERAASSLASASLLSFTSARALYSSTTPRWLGASALTPTQALSDSAHPKPTVELRTESNVRPPPICINVKAPPKPECFAHKISYQKNPDPSIEAPMRVYQSKEPTLLPKIHMEDCVCEFMFSRWRKQDPRKPACVQVETGETVTYGELIKLAKHVSDVLHTNCRVRKGDTVLVCMYDTVHFAPIAYGVMNTGATLSTTNVNITEDMLAHQMEASEAKVVVTTKHCLPVVQRAGHTVKKRTGSQVKILLAETIHKLKADSMPDYHRAGLHAERDDVVLIPFSSGTTGDPKGVQLTNMSLDANIQQTIQAFGLTNTDVQLSVLPFFHVTGFTIGMSAILAAGGTLLMQARFDVRSYVQAVQKQRVSFVLVAPPVVAAIVRYAQQAGLSGPNLFPSLRLMRSSGAPLSPSLWSAIQCVCPNTDVGQIYGMTEMSPMVVTTPLRARDSDADVPVVRKKRKQDTTVVGVLVPDTELRLVRVEDTQQSAADVSSGIDVEEGSEGELWVSGPQRMLGYVDPIATREVVVNGWYRTGDIGYIDNETGQLCITDRLRELIKYKGFYVSPASVEAILLECPEVAACVVFGVPDTHGTSFEVPRALVALVPDVVDENATPEQKAKQLKSIEAMLMRYVDTRSPPHKRVHGGIRFVDSIEKTINGKVKRRYLRKLEIERLAAEQEASDSAHTADEEAPSETGATSATADR